MGFTDFSSDAGLDREGPERLVIENCAYRSQN